MLTSEKVIQAGAINYSASARCPECDSMTSLDCELVLGQQLYCSVCQAALEIVDLSPLRLDYAFIASQDRSRSTPLV